MEFARSLKYIAGGVCNPANLLVYEGIVYFAVNVPKKVEAFNSPVGGISESWGNTQAKTLPLL